MPEAGGTASGGMPPGTAVYAFCDATVPKKFKYAVCAIPAKLLFFLINTRKPFLTQGIMDVSAEELPCLKHRSFLDTGKMLPFTPKSIEEALRKGKVWPVPAPLKTRIKDCVRFHGILPRWQEEDVLTSF